MKLTDPKLTLYFLGNDLEPGHETTQILTNEDIVKSLVFKRQRFSSLKSSSDSVQILIRRKCSSTEDIVATDGNIKAVLTDGEQTLFTGYISTNFTWTVTDHGEEALSATIEGVGTRLLSQAYIETGKHFFDGTAASVIYAVVNPLGIVLRSGDERKLLQSVSYTAEAGTTCREILDQLCYECNAVYWFNNLGELCIQQITADTSAAEEVDSLVFNGGKAISLSKNLRTYKGARVTYKQLGTANNYLVYRNTTNATSQRTCDLVLQGGEYFDGAEIYTEAEWSEATADTFREPTLLGAVNAASESSIVGSGKIVNIDNLRADVEKENGLSADFENVGGGYFKLTAHNSASVARAFYRLDLYADIVYEKSDGVIRTTIDGTTEGKTLIEEEMEFIHDKDNAQKHANLLAQYYRYCGATYTFYTNKQLELGSVIRLHDTTFSGLDVFVLLTATEEAEGTSTVKCTGVAISTFDLEADVYHGTTEAAKQSGAQGPAGEPGASTEVQYALGDSIVDPPTAEMLWGGVEMTWNGSVMTWNEGLYTDEVPEMQRGKYIWMRSRVGDGPWNYTRLTGAVSWDAESLGVATTETPKTSSEGLGLIPGDYFVAGATFTEDSVEYKKGYAYIYNGATWDVMDLFQPGNAQKAQNLAAALFSSGINVTDSTASIWGWFQNLVSQNAVISRLTAELAEIKTLIITGNLINDAVETVDASEPTVLTFVTSTQNYYKTPIGQRDPVYAGTCPQVRISDVESLIPVGISYATSGSVTYNGTTYTATENDPIKIRFEKTADSIARLVFYQNNVMIVEYRGQFTSSNVSESGYMAHWVNVPGSGYIGDPNATIANNSLGIASSLGMILTHDILPKNTSVDKIGTPEQRFASGAFTSLDVAYAGWKYSFWGNKMTNLTIPSNSTSSVSTTTDLTDYNLCFVTVENPDNSAFATAWLPVNVIGNVWHRITMPVGLFIRQVEVVIRRSTGQITATAISGISGQTNLSFSFLK